MNMQKNELAGSGRFDFVGKVGAFTVLSLFLIIGSFIYMGIHGLNYGIDFRGGTEFQVKFDPGTTIDDVRSAVNELQLGDVGVQAIGEDHQNEYLIRFQGKTGKTDKETNELLNADIAKLRETIDTKFASAKPEVRRVDTVGPQVGSELQRNSLLAVFYSLLVILVYIACRFDLKYAPGAIYCLFHDTVITLAVFILVGKEVNIPILAALLTLIGYSLNDTIVIFDRIRDVQREYSDKSFRFIINKAINDVVGRTLITAGTSLASATCLWYFASGTVSDIAFAIGMGILLGTYSSIYVAVPTVLLLDKFKKA